MTLQFREKHVDGDRRYDIEKGSQVLGQIGYHYGFKEWCYWAPPHGYILPASILDQIATFVKGIEGPTQEERDAYFAYEGDPLAR